MIFQLGKSKTSSERPLESETIQRWRSASENSTLESSENSASADESLAAVNAGELLGASTIELKSEAIELSVSEADEKTTETLKDEALTEAPTRAAASALTSSAEKLFSAAFDRPKPSRGADRAKYDAPAWISDLVKKSAPAASPTTTRNAATARAARSIDDVKSALGPGTVIEGKLSFDQPVRIDGSLIGEIRSSSVLVVGEQAQVRANVSVGTLVILGAVSGSVTATEAVEVRHGGILEADIRAGSLIIEEGGFFRGGCNRG